MRLRFGDGTWAQEAFFGALVALFAVGLAIAVADKVDRIGGPDPGFLIDRGYLSPTREEASRAGLRGGGRAVSVNGWRLRGTERWIGEVRGIRLRIGQTNRLTFERPGGGRRTVRLTVRPWTWRAVLFTEGATDLIGLAFFAVGLVAFLLRPFELDTWAVLVVSSAGGGILLTLFVPPTWEGAIVPYLSVAYGLLAFGTIHLALAFPVVSRLLREGGWALRLLYLAAAVKVAHALAAWSRGDAASLDLAATSGLWIFTSGVALALGRALALGLGRGRGVIGQRARILVAGMLLGLAPVAVLEIARDAFHAVTIDSRFAYWAIAIFLVALARVTVRPDLVNARIAVRRAIIYAFAVGILTALAIALSAERSYAVAILLFPLLYLWPRFDAMVNEWLYPQRTRFPELVRSTGEAYARAGAVEEVLDVLAGAPRRLCDARAGVAFLLGRDGGAAVVRAAGPVAPPAAHGLERDALVRLLVATRKEIVRSRVAVEPQFRNVQEECLASFDRFGAEILLPLFRGREVAGGLAVGPRLTGDPYEAADLDALSTVAQQAAQAIGRVEATERLRAREREFAELARFFPPQIIEQVMARGGASGLRSQRRLVTVLFADLRGFTAFSDQAEPEEVMSTLAQFHEVMGRRVAEFAGTVERFAGDGVMVFFNDPVEQPDHALRAARTALSARADVRRLREQWGRQGFAIDVGMGIHTGYATCGFVGYEGRRDYGVIGNVTNLAARLSDAAAAGEILVTERVRGELCGSIRTEPVGELQLKGFSHPQRAYRLLDEEAAAAR